jgi:hypothetical protein
LLYALLQFFIIFRCDCKPESQPQAGAGCGERAAPTKTDEVNPNEIVMRVEMSAIATGKRS